MIVMKKDKIVKTSDTEPPDGKDINSWQEGENCKHLKDKDKDKFKDKKKKKKGYKTGKTKSYISIV